MRWLDRCQQLDKRGDKDLSLDLLYSQSDKMFWAGRFEEYDNMLRTIDPRNYSILTLIGLMTMSKNAEKNLPSYPIFFDNAVTVIAERRELELGLLNGLEPK